MDWSLYDGDEGADASECDAEEEADCQHFAVRYAAVEKWHPTEKEVESK